MKKFKTFIWKYGWLLLAMIALYFSNGDRPLEITVWLYPVFLLRFFRENKLWKAIIFSLPLIIFITIIADKGILPMPMNITIILTVITSIIALIPYVADRLFKRSLPKGLNLLLFPVTVVALEAFVASDFTGGTWGNPVYGISNLPLLQFLSIAGLWGLMFLVYWTAAVINEVWENRDQLKNIGIIITVYLTVMLIIYGFGLWRLHQDKPVDKMIKVAGITPGPEYRDEMMGIFGKIFSESKQGKFDPESIRSQINNNFNALLTESIRMAGCGVEMVVWSEGATFIFENDEESSIQQAVQSALEHQMYLGLGLAVLKDNCQDLLAKNEPFVKNKLILISPDGKIDWEYAKWNLAPGMERMMTIPGDGKLKSALTAQGSVTGAICYDMDFPAYIRQAGKLKSDLLLAPSNDWAEIINTHAQMARFRAIENGISLLRPASSGISIAVDPYGKILSQVDGFKSNGAPLVAVVPMRSVQTLYTIVGDFWTWVCAIIGSLLVVFAIIGKFRNRHKS